MLVQASSFLPKVEYAGFTSMGAISPLCMRGYLLGGTVQERLPNLLNGRSKTLSEVIQNALNSFLKCRFTYLELFR